MLSKAPTVSAIIAMLKNPAYGGAFVYGRTGAMRAPLPGARPMQKPRPREEWRFIVKDKYPAYISWETFDKIQEMLRDNYAEYVRIPTKPATDSNPKPAAISDVKPARFPI
jgi:Recombinase